MWNIVLIVIVVFNVMFAVDSYYTAYDEYVGFNVCGNRLNYKNDYSLIDNNNIDLALSVENGGIISAFALLKGAFHNYPVQTIAKNFNRDDFVQLAKFVCKGKEERDGKAMTITSISVIQHNYYLQNSTITFNIFLNKLHGAKDPEILSADEL
jgi:hypothetical protein